MFCSCRISTDKRVARSLCNSRVSCHDGRRAVRHLVLCGDVFCAEFAGDAELVFGSDDEKAMVAALRQVFPNAEHIFCARHLEENVRRFLTDTAGMATRERERVLNRLREATRVDADQTGECETVISALTEAVRAAAPSTNVPEKILAVVLR